MNTRFDDVEQLNWLGIPLGVVLALVSLMTLVGMPWRYSNSGVVSILQPLGALLLLAGSLGFAYYLYATQ